MDNHFLELTGLTKYTQDMKQYVQTQVNTRVPTTRTVNGKALSSNISLTASDVSARSSSWTPTAAEVGALPITGGILTGDLTIKGSSNYGTKINLGDGDFVHISEPSDDCMEVKAKKVNFVLSDTTDAKFTINGANPFGEASGGGSGSIEVIRWTGNDSGTLSLKYTTNKTPIALRIGGSSPKTENNFFVILETVFGGSTSFSAIAEKVMVSTSMSISSAYPMTLSTSSKTITFTLGPSYLINLSNFYYYAMVIFS